MKKNRVLMIAVGNYLRASSRLRIHAWIPYLEKAGIECRVLVEYDDQNYRAEQSSCSFAARLWDFTCRSFSTSRLCQKVKELIHWAEVIFIQESLLPIPLMNHIIQSGKRIIFDFTDPVHLRSPSNDNWIRSLLHKTIYIPRFRYLIEKSHAVLVENELFCPKIEAAGGKPYLVRGPCDVHMFRPRASYVPNDKVILGWTGSPSTFALFRPIIADLQKMVQPPQKILLKLIGAPSESANLSSSSLLIEVIPWSIDTEAEEVASFDIALSYQHETEFTRFRGGGKLLLYMAAGLPIVTSPFGIGDQVIFNGVNGFVATSREEWEKAISLLVGDLNLRRSIGVESRRRAVEMYSYESYLPFIIALLSGETPPHVPEIEKAKHNEASVFGG